jgi:hypothetical protein
MVRPMLPSIRTWSARMTNAERIGWPDGNLDPVGEPVAST